MIDLMLPFAFGLIVGAGFGMILTALLAAGGDKDD